MRQKTIRSERRQRDPVALTVTMPWSTFRPFQAAAGEAFLAREKFISNIPGLSTATFSAEAYAMALAEAWLSAEVGRFFHDSTTRLNMEAEQWRLRSEGVIA